MGHRAVAEMDRLPQRRYEVLRLRTAAPMRRIAAAFERRLEGLVILTGFALMAYAIWSFDWRVGLFFAGAGLVISAVDVGRFLRRRP
jgi:hypothetical protein